jgi:hypothetical protein
MHINKNNIAFIIQNNKTIATEKLILKKRKKKNLQ